MHAYRYWRFQKKKKNRTKRMLRNDSLVIRRYALVCVPYMVNPGHACMGMCQSGEAREKCSPPLPLVVHADAASVDGSSREAHPCDAVCKRVVTPYHAPTSTEVHTLPLISVPISISRKLIGSLTNPPLSPLSQPQSVHLSPQRSSQGKRIVGKEGKEGKAFSPLALLRRGRI